MTTVGPLALSGFAAGPSVEGPRAASVSVRFSSARTASGADVVTSGCALSEELISVAFVNSTGAIWGAPESCVVVVPVIACASADDWSVFISTALEARLSWPDSVCDTEADDWGIFCAFIDGWSSEGVAMVGRNNPACAT